MNTHYITLPFTTEDIKACKAGDLVYISGEIIGARDAAHKRLYNSYLENKPDFDVYNQVIYYVGPTPAFGNHQIGSAGPTTSARMDQFTPLLMDHGLKVTIGKGERSPEVIQSIIDNQGLYLVAIGGTGAVISQSISSYHEVLYPELGPESLKKIVAKDMMTFVAYDSYGNDIFQN